MRVCSAVQPEGLHRVVVEDDGVGWSGVGAIKGTGLGSKILKAMTRTLDAQLVYEPTDRGTRVAIIFPVAGSEAKAGDAPAGSRESADAPEA